MIYDIRLPHDPHGQPLRPFRANDLQNAAKAIERLSAIALGILADGIVTDQEAVFFRDWLQKNKPAYPNRWFDDVIRRVEGIFADGKIDDEEREELVLILKALNGEQGETLSTPIALDTPPPRIQFRGRVFCPTGKFCYGARKKVAEAIVKRGGVVVPKFCDDVNYLVVGTFSSRDWVESSWGRKIEAATKKRDKTGVAIVGEEHWRDHVQLLPTFSDGFAEDFRMAIPDAYAGAFEARAFRPGDVFYPTRKAYDGLWADALPEIDFSLVVESFSNEIVGFRVNEKEGGRLVGKRSLKLPYVDFVECLRAAQVPEYS
jgi:hypothetical protein